MHTNTSKYSNRNLFPIYLLRPSNTARNVRIKLHCPHVHVLVGYIMNQFTKVLHPILSCLSSQRSLSACISQLTGVPKIMASSLFSVTEHTVPCQHIREYPNAIKNGHASLQLAIKEYRPLNNIDASPGSVTIIAMHGLGFPKVFKRLSPSFSDLS